MDAVRAYDFEGTHLTIYEGFAGQVTDQVVVERQRVVPFAAGLVLAQPLVVRYPLDLGEPEHLFDIEIGVARGEPACLAIRSAHGEPLTSMLLRFPLGEIVTEFAARNTYRVFRTKRGRYIGVRYSPAFEGMLGFGDDLKELRADVGSRRRIVDPEFLDKVAAIYREAVAEKQPPAKVIAERLGPTTRSNARRWIMRARKAGKLRKSVGVGRAGEDPSERGTR